MIGDQRKLKSIQLDLQHTIKSTPHFFNQLRSPPNGFQSSVGVLPPSSPNVILTIVHTTPFQCQSGPATESVWLRGRAGTSQRHLQGRGSNDEQRCIYVICKNERMRTSCANHPSPAKRRSGSCNLLQKKCFEHLCQIPRICAFGAMQRECNQLANSTFLCQFPKLSVGGHLLSITCSQY